MQHESHTARSRVAVIDDSREIQDLLSDLLSAGGYEVLAFSGDDASILADLAAAQPDLIILDLLLGDPKSGLSGWDILQLARRHRGLRHVPILVCSADVREMRARRAQFDDDARTLTLEKPFSIDALERSVAHLASAQSLPRWDDEVDLVLVADRDARLVHASTAMLSRLGLSLAELRRLGVADIVAYGREWTDREWRRYLDERRWEGDVTLLTRDGRRLDARGRADIVEGKSAVWHVSRLTLVSGSDDGDASG